MEKREPCEDKVQRLTNTIYTKDNLEIMKGMNSNSVDLIYLDPPFNSKRDYEAPIGSEAEGAEFKDTWEITDTKLDWHGEIAKTNQSIYEFISASRYSHGESMMAYLIMMAIRLIEMHRILKEDGSIYLHCDPTASHYLKIIMDCIFGRKNFRNEIIWCYTGPSNTKRYFPKKTDTILFYTKSNQWTFNAEDIKIPYKKLDTGKTKGIFKEDFALDPRGKIPENWWSNFTPVGRLKHERLKFPTQKPLALLKRIILASSNVGDIVFDPFCGCATALVAAQLESRAWIGVDLCREAIPLMRLRLERKKDELPFIPDFKNETKPPKRTDYEQQRIEERELARLNDEQGNLPHYTVHKSELYGKQKGYCNGCEIHYYYKDLEVDHIEPKSVYQLDTSLNPDRKSNLQLLCSSCNRIKGDRTQEYLINELKKRKKERY